MKTRASGTSTLSRTARFSRRPRKHWSARSRNASATATSRQLASARRHCSTAPEPRPPQPIRPTRMTSLPCWACALVSTLAANAPPATAEVVRKSRRVVSFAMGRSSRVIKRFGIILTRQDEKVQEILFLFSVRNALPAASCHRHGPVNAKRRGSIRALFRDLRLHALERLGFLDSPHHAEAHPVGVVPPD